MRAAAASPADGKVICCSALLSCAEAKADERSRASTSTEESKNVRFIPGSFVVNRERICFSLMVQLPPTSAASARAHTGAAAGAAGTSATAARGCAISRGCTAVVSTRLLPARRGVAGTCLRPVPSLRSVLTRPGLTVSGRRAARCAAISLGSGFIAVRSTAAMLWIVLPIAAASAAARRLSGRAVAAVYVVAVATVYVGIAIEIVIVVDADVVVSAPTAAISPASAPCGSHRETNTEGNRHTGRVIPHRRISNRRIGINWRAVHDGRVIRWDVNDFRIGLLNHDDLFRFDDFGFNFLLFRGF